MVRIVRPLYSPSNVDAIQSANTVLANGANGATVVNGIGGVAKNPNSETAWIDLSLGVAATGVGRAQAADLVTQVPNHQNHNLASKGAISTLYPSVAKKLGSIGFAVSGISTIKDGVDVYGSMRGDAIQSNKLAHVLGCCQRC